MAHLTTDSGNHRIVPERPSPWLTPLLVGIAGTLASACMIWIATTMVDVQTRQAVMEEKIIHQTGLLVTALEDTTDETERLSTLVGQIWPRLRNADKNISLLRNELIDMCKRIVPDDDCEFELDEPQKF